MIESQGEQFASNEKASGYLRYQAWYKCADGIIGVRKGYTNRTEGYQPDTKNDREYSAPVFSGIAVRITRDSASQARHPSVADTAFVSRVQAVSRRESKRADDQLTASFLMPVIGCFIGIGYMMLKEQ